MILETRPRHLKVDDITMAPFEREFQTPTAMPIVPERKSFEAHAADFRESNIPVEFADAFNNAFTEIVTGDYPTTLEYQRIATRLFGKSFTPQAAEYAVVYGVTVALFKRHQSHLANAVPSQTHAIGIVEESRGYAEDGLRALQGLERSLTGQDNLIFKGRTTPQALAWTRASVETLFAKKSNQERISRLSQKTALKPLYRRPQTIAA